MGTRQVLGVLEAQGRATYLSFPLLAGKSQSKWPSGSDGACLQSWMIWVLGKNCILGRVGTSY